MFNTHEFIYLMLNTHVGTCVLINVWKHACSW